MRTIRFKEKITIAGRGSAAAVFGVLALATHAAFAQSNLPSPEEMWKVIQEQAKQIQALQDQVQQLTGQVKSTDQRLETVADAVDDQDAAGFPGKKTHLGGYGELHYNNLEDRHGSKDKEEIDFHRFVLFVGHDFDERLRFFSELEVEHALVGDTKTGEGKPGEVELEQAYLEMDLDAEAKHRAKAGLFLVPVGILNETHEPPTFYGIERNAVETNILPTTWWEAGLGLSGRFTDALSYDLAYTSGLAVKADYKVRDGRRKVANAPAEDGALTGRLRWKQSGLELGATLHYQTDLTQGGANGAPEDSSGLLAETHAAIEMGRFGLRALYARWELDADAAEALGRDVQQGWYIEPSYKITDKLGLFARYSYWDNSAGDSAESAVKQLDVGVNYWPTENVVLKLDYQDQDAASGVTELDGFNAGIGYQF
ncbi:MAG: hypothetical protein A3K19_06570 [Lentisphaerae bacterium RIFOXYB12_FULL_65_16]|nr:MAG: hypothetical protein A3K18_02070 [Lentisphaerae bacterium RIFOXYA12_64_32]OGV93102.1 MAG: hypothetical protein A3K19_06570 [Lentisphaerae bacterium RIFOXYB12_FULL_65_16]